MSDMEIERMNCPHCNCPLDVRHNASDLVTIAKPVIHDIEAAGYKVLTRGEYEGLQRLYEACIRERDANAEFARVMKPGGYFDAEEARALRKCEEAQVDMWKVVHELEALNT